MTTDIRSNGSKWAGEAPDSVDTLLDVLKRETLEPDFERYGDFITPHEAPEMTWFFGNFRTVSHVFNISSNDPETIAKLTAAIRANQASKAYRLARKGMKLPRRRKV